MLKPLLILTALATPAFAQMQHTPEMQHTEGMQPGVVIPGQMAPDTGMGGMNGSNMMNHQMMQSMHGGMMFYGMMVPNMGGHGMMSGASMQGHNMAGMGTQAAGIGGSPLTEAGQSAFATIAEVVNVLKADPNTDWSNVSIDALREHLRDMDVVTIDSSTVTEDVGGGVRFIVTGAEDVSPSIQRMVMAHAQVMNGVDGWSYSAEEIPDGAILTVIPPEADLAKLKGLGFYGIMASGMHHQPHHWMMATGGNPHM